MNGSVVQWFSISLSHTTALRMLSLEGREDLGSNPSSATKHIFLQIERKGRYACIVLTDHHAKSW